MPVFGVILVRIFPHSDWMQRDTTYLSVFMRENADQSNSEYGHFSRSLNLYTRSVLNYLTMKIFSVFLFYASTNQQTLNDVSAAVLVFLFVNFKHISNLYYWLWTCSGEVNITARLFSLSSGDRKYRNRSLNSANQ